MAAVAIQIRYGGKAGRAILSIILTQAVKDDARHRADLGGDGHFLVLVETVVLTVGHTLLHVNGDTILNNRELACGGTAGTHVNSCVKHDVNSLCSHCHQTHG